MLVFLSFDQINVSLQLLLYQESFKEQSGVVACLSCPNQSASQMIFTSNCQVFSRCDSLSNHVGCLILCTRGSSRISEQMLQSSSHCLSSTDLLQLLQQRERDVTRRRKATAGFQAKPGGNMLVQQRGYKSTPLRGNNFVIWS